MPVVSTWKKVLTKYNTSSNEVQYYFQHLPKLIKSGLYEICITYIFAQIELAHNMSIYCGLLKLHKCDRELTMLAIEKQHITRESFKKLYENVFGQPISKITIDILEESEKVRDKIMHGKGTNHQERMKTVCLALDYAESYNQEVALNGGFKPFGSLIGFKGRGVSLSKNTSRWILKGMGFSSIS